MKFFSALRALFDQLWLSVVRTFVPQVAGVIVAAVTHLGLDVDNALVLATVTELFALVYYVAIRGLEEFRDSKYGVWLGKAVRPFYFKES
jgi:hypothetical protein